MATFLTRTSILERVEPQVAEEITGLPGASDRLRSLAHANLFIEPAAGSHESYRYHRLLRDFLRVELERLEPGATNVLHRRASGWYAANGIMDVAIRHANAGGDVDGAARLVTAATLPTYYSGRTATLERWFDDFGEAVFERQPALAVMAGWVHILNGRADEADRMADIAERSTFGGRADDGAASFASSRAMLRAIMARRGPEDALANAAFAVSQEQPGSRWRGVALFLLGSAHMARGDVDAADAAFRDSAAAAPAVGGASPIAAAEAIVHRDGARRLEGGRDAGPGEPEGPHGLATWTSSSPRSSCMPSARGSPSIAGTSQVGGQTSFTPRWCARWHHMRRRGTRSTRSSSWRGPTWPARTSQVPGASSGRPRRSFTGAPPSGSS